MVDLAASTPKLSESLRQGEVDLAVFPFPRALSELWRARETGTLRLRQLQFEKSIIIREGTPVHASSNIAEETLARFLINRGELMETVVYQAESKAVKSGRDLGDLLVEMKALSPYELFKAMRRCLGLSILEAFRWAEGVLEWDPREPDVDGKVLLKVNPESLVLRGISSQAPIEQIRADFPGGLAVVYLGRPALLESKAGLPFNTIESRIAKHLAAPATIADLAQKASVDEEMVQRLIYALLLLGQVAPADEVRQEASAAAQAQAAAPQEASAAPAATTPQHSGLTDDEKKRIDEAYLASKSQNYFELLGVDQKVMYAHLRQAFLSRCELFSPMSYRDRELGDRAEYVEELFVTTARAFATLADPHDRATYIDRLEKAEQRRQRQAGDAPPSTYATESTIFEATEHIANGVRLLNSNKAAEALSHFQFAVDCEPKNASALAHLGYCQFVADPEHNLAVALQSLQRATSVDPSYAESYFFLGRVYEMRQDRESAWSSYSVCVQRKPDHSGAKAALNRLRELRKK